jgi:hypothetical protein
MNELIEKLSDQAIEGMPGAWNIPDEFCEKFAELIVQECAKVCRDQPNIYAMKVASDICATSIEEHFGVAN